MRFTNKGGCNYNHNLDIRKYKYFRYYCFCECKILSASLLDKCSFFEQLPLTQYNRLDRWNRMKEWHTFILLYKQQTICNSVQSYFDKCNLERSLGQAENTLHKIIHNNSIIIHFFFIFRAQCNSVLPTFVSTYLHTYF